MAVAVDLEQIEREASLLSSAELAAYLQAQVGQSLTAYMAGLTDRKVVGRWARGQKPRDRAVMRLRSAYQVVRLLAEAYGVETAKAWLFGSNSRLDGEAPAWVIRHARSPDDLRLVVPVARTFAGGVS